MLLPSWEGFRSRLRKGIQIPENRLYNVKQEIGWIYSIQETQSFDKLTECLHSAFTEVSTIVAV